MHSKSQHGSKGGCKYIFIVYVYTAKLGVMYGALTVLDVIMIGMCCLSIFLTFGSLRRAAKLAKV